MTTTTQGAVKLTLTLASGEVITWTGKKLPQHWKSFLMQRAPYGTDYAGATWKRERI